MSFQDSACNIYLDSDPGDTDRKTSLSATCNNDQGTGMTSQLKLDEALGNQDGRFSWDGQNFSNTARNVRLGMEQREPVLHAELKNESGEYTGSDTQLGEHVGNVDGQLRWNS
ncbi:CVNH domain-containing protein [Aspergillus glaucus CBS 516.65]|uniref:Cyanovirin-N domain-containing protein n=1 Tax=Aspergillus glaucus CBS 516.65 TaxID=1160497 RepID=A0A1L9V9U1_ASPGL|nr:hypothetical protein ASPGLDRAFT_134024 [Aspergillus glaucus CBS 516.65]OJJ80716.1 hypothetical protein ASPGLDRAFT_134024 [Aspergillus glaucus CBS 516.65]